MKVDKTFHLHSTSVKRLDRLSAKTGTGRSQLLERGINLLTAIENGTMRVVKVAATVLPLEAALQETAAVDAAALEFAVRGLGAPVRGPSLRECVAAYEQGVGRRGRNGHDEKEET